MSVTHSVCDYIKVKNTILPNVLEHDKYENRAREFVYCDSHISDINEHKNLSFTA